MAKYKPSPAEIANDPSLKWHEYRIWEAVWSDGHNADVRFHAYVDGKVQIANMVMGLLPGLVDPLTIRRSSVQPRPACWEPVRMRNSWFAMERRSHQTVPCGTQAEAEELCTARNTDNLR